MAEALYDGERTMATMFENIARGAGWSALAAVHGTSVSYRPHDGEASTIAAVWRPGECVAGWVEHGEMERARGVLLVSPADVAAPDTRDQVTIDAVEWAVELVEQGGPYWRLQLVRHTERRPGFGSSRMREDL